MDEAGVLDARSREPGHTDKPIMEDGPAQKPSAGRAGDAAGGVSSRIQQIRKLKAAKLAQMKAEKEREERLDNRNGTTRKSTGLVYDDRMLEHHCPWDPHHIESPARLARIWTRCEELDLVERCQRIPSREAADHEVLLYHNQQFVDVLENSRQQTSDASEEVCTSYDSVYLSPGSAVAARLATGAAIDLVEEVMAGNIHCGMGLVRPPGHHAMEGELNGFCGYNNVVVAAMKALNTGVKKILIVDFDLHHGQGVQRAFYNDPRVLYMSVHRYENGSYWPHLRESNFDHVGEGEGLGFNVNVPLNVIGCGNSEYLAIFHRIFLPIAAEFKPELVIVSAGYDAAVGCPEGCMRVTPAGYAHLVSSLSALCGGRLVVMLEGGYCLDSLSEAAALTLRTLLGDAAPSLPPTGQIDPSVLKSILGTTAYLSPYWKCMRIRETVSEIEKPILQEHYPVLEFRPPPDFPPAKFPTRDYYLVFSEAVQEKWKLEIAHINLATRLRQTQYKVCVGFDEEMCRHEDDESHPECPERIQRIYSRIKEGGMLEKKDVTELLKGRKLSLEEATLVHTTDHWENMQMTSNLETEERDELAETYNSIYLNQHSFECGLLSAGCVLSVVDNVLQDSRAGLAIVRPPGHHAEEDEPHGFCIFNNVAIAAQYALSVHGLKRVLILDWDVHHGNGIQHMFYNSSQVLYISIHRYDQASFFPCSEDAAADKVGEGEGRGFNINIPWNSRRCGDLEYYLAFMNVILPVAYEYGPDLVLISAGFDAARGDPLGGFKVSPEMYGLMTHHLSALAEGRVVVALEGGYNLASISECMYECGRALCGDPLPVLNLDAELRPDVVDTVREVLQIQQQFWHSLQATTIPIPTDFQIFTELSKDEKEIKPTSSSAEINNIADSLPDLSISMPRSHLIDQSE